MPKNPKGKVSSRGFDDVNAIHSFRNDSEMNPLVKRFSRKAWNLIPTLNYEGKLYPKGGWKEQKAAPKVNTPEEALDLTGEQKAAPKAPPAPKKATPPAPPAPKKADSETKKD